MIKTLKQFILLGDDVATALRKTATVIGVENYDDKSFSPLLKWSKQLDVLEPITITLVQIN